MTLNKLIIPAGEKEQIEVYSHEGPFDQGIAALRKEGLSVITARELAEARMLTGWKSPISWQSTRVAENVNYFPNGDILVASRDYNPLLRGGALDAQAANILDAQAANIDAHCIDFYLDKHVAKQLQERAETDPEKAIKSGVLRFPREKLGYSVRTDKYFEDHPLTYFLFRDSAKPYGQFVLSTSGTSFMNVHLIKDSRKWYRFVSTVAFGMGHWEPIWHDNHLPFGITLKVDGGYFGFDLDGHDQKLQMHLPTYGIRRVPAPEVPQKSVKFKFE